MCFNKIGGSVCKFDLWIWPENVFLSFYSAFIRHLLNQADHQRTARGHLFSPVAGPWARDLPTYLSLSLPAHRFSSCCAGCREGNEPWEPALLDWREEPDCQTDLLVTESLHSPRLALKSLWQCISCSSLFSLVLHSESFCFLLFWLPLIFLFFSLPNLLSSPFTPVRCPTMMSSSQFS